MKTIIDTAVAAGTFTAFLGALKAASFLDTLRAPGPYTVFMPTDEAFRMLTPAALAAMLKDIRRLKTTVTYHVVSGTVPAKDLKAGDLKTVEGTSLLVDRNGGEITVNGAKIVQADIPVSNGVIHAISAILVPKGAKLTAVA
jgi:uncharacterized surface protein with fasciclin (FAS1) repeats